MSRLNLLLLGLFCTRIRYTKAAEKCLKTIDMRECSGSGPSLTSPPTCSNVTVCQDIFNISTIDIQPYSSVLMLRKYTVLKTTLFYNDCHRHCRPAHYDLLPSFLTPVLLSLFKTSFLWALRSRDGSTC